MLLKSERNYYQLIEDIRRGLLSRSSMVLHIGAHKGTEAKFYDQLDLQVLWIEANPEIIPALDEVIKPYPKQKSICGLLGEQNIERIQFYVANNDGQSSSIFNFGREMNHENLEMIQTFDLPMRRLDSLVGSDEIPLNSHWVIDVQGAELQVIRGADKLICKAYSMEVEVSTREEYSGGAKFNEVNDALNDHGLFPLWQPKENSHEDVIFIRRSGFKGLER